MSISPDLQSAVWQHRHTLLLPSTACQLQKSMFRSYDCFSNFLNKWVIFSYQDGISGQVLLKEVLVLCLMIIWNHHTSTDWPKRRSMKIASFLLGVRQTVTRSSFQVASDENLSNAKSKLVGKGVLHPFQIIKTTTYNHQWNCEAPTRCWVLSFDIRLKPFSSKLMTGALLTL